jgi:hypothetical protein
VRKLFYRKPTWWLIKECKKLGIEKLGIEPSNDDVSEKGKLVLALIKHRVIVSRNKRARAVSPASSNNTPPIAQMLRARLLLAMTLLLPQTLRARLLPTTHPANLKKAILTAFGYLLEQYNQVFFTPRKGFCR